MSTVITESLDLGIEARRVQATARLAFARETHPELHRALASARLDLAVAIIAMDETEDIPGRHNLQEQAAVNSALLAFGQAMADLIRGEEGSSISDASTRG